MNRLFTFLPLLVLLAPSATSSAQFGPPPALLQESTMRLYNQNVRLTVNYRFGKMTFQPKKRRNNRQPDSDGLGQEEN